MARTRKPRTYLVGRFCYSVPVVQRGIACVRIEDINCLPPTMLDLKQLLAYNKREAIAKYKQLGGTMSEAKSGGGSPVQIKRDPFARATLMREVDHDSSACTWCGAIRKSVARYLEVNVNRCRALYRYYWESDGTRSETYRSKPYCCIGCYRSDTDDNN